MGNSNRVSELNHLKLFSLTHLVMGAKCQLGPQFFSVWASPCDFSTWASLDFLTGWWMGSKIKCPERENHTRFLQPFMI